MQYEYRSGVKQKRKIGPKAVGSLFVVAVAGIYFAISALAPTFPAFATGGHNVASLLKGSRPDGSNKLYIPRLNIVIPIVTGDTEQSLSMGAWHREPRNGDPKYGGHFVLSAYKYSVGFTPAETRDKSPFYHLANLQQGDEIYADYNGTRYAYRVIQNIRSEDDADKLEARVNIDRMTLYAASSNGERADDVQIDAEPVGVVAWQADGPKIKKDTTN